MKNLLSQTDRVNNSNHSAGWPDLFLSIQAENMISDWIGHSLNHPDRAAAANAFTSFSLFACNL